MRPLRDRILFAYWDKNKFILLSQFIKQSQKTPKKEIEKAKRLLKDYKNRGLVMNRKELTWEEVKSSLNLTPEEKAEIQLEEDLIEAIIAVRKKSDLSQRELSKKAGVKQPVISRIESKIRSPQAATLIKLLYPMGYTLRVVPLDTKKKDNKMMTKKGLKREANTQ